MHAARHRRPHPSALRRTATALGLAGLLVSALPTAPAVGQVADPCGGDYTPALATSTVTQGVATYDRLVRGKTTLVRQFLTAPACAAATTTVQLVRAEVRVQDGATEVATVSSTPGTLGPSFPTLPSASQGAGDDGPWNPVVAVPGSVTAGLREGALPLRFLGRVTYRVQTLPGGPVTESVSGWRELAGATLSPTSRPLRVLVVPMGDAGSASVPVPRGSQFPTRENGGTPLKGQYADTVVQKAMQTAARVLPVADGTGDLRGTTGGLRYRLDSAAMVDLGMNPDGLGFQPRGGRACVTGSRFAGPVVNGVRQPGIASRLAQHLDAWNRANTGFPADRVVGVLWQSVSAGVAGVGGIACAEGLASLDGTTAFLRLLPDSTTTTSSAVGTTTTPNPSMSGALAVMELAHTAGAVPTGDPREPTGDGNHSRFVSADPTGSKRAYDTTQATWVPSPRSGLNYTGSSEGYEDPSKAPTPWHDLDVLLEEEDWAFLQCELTAAGTVGLVCPPKAQAGGATVAGAVASVVLAGTTDGTPAGTDLVSSYDAAAARTEPDDSPLRLVLRDAQGTVLPACQPGTPGCSPQGDVGVPARTMDSVHDHSGPAVVPHVGSPVRSVYAVVPVPPLAASFELWNGPPGPRCTADVMPAGCLYARATSADPVVTADSPSAGATFTDPVDLTPLAGDDTAPALSPDADALAWTSPAGVLVRRRDTVTGLPTGQTVGPLGGTDPSWSPDGRTLAYSDTDGDIVLVPVTRTGDSLALGAPTVVYDHLLQPAPVLGSSAAASPSWSPDGEALAVVIDRGLWRVRAAGGSTRVTCDLSGLSANPTCRPLLTGRDVSDPDWGVPGGPQGLVAYVEPDGVWTLDPASPATTRRLRLPGATAPSWGAGLLASLSPESGGPVTVTVSDPAAPDASGRYVVGTSLTAADAAARPALARSSRVLALSRTVGPDVGRDVLAGTVRSSGSTITLNATTAGDPALLRATALLGCGDGQDPALVALRPTRTTGGAAGGTATFVASFADDRGCPGGTLSAVVDNGWDRSEPVAVRSYPNDTTPPPPAPALSTPLAASSSTQYAPMTLTGSSLDLGTTNAPGTVLSWTLTGPAGSGFAATPVGTGPLVRVDAPVPGGFLPGSYVATVTATGARGAASSASSTFSVRPDPGHQGVDARVSFAPRSLDDDPSRKTVTVRVVPQGQRLDRVSKSSVRLVSVGGRAVSLPALRWERSELDDDLDDGDGLDADDDDGEDDDVEDGGWSATFDRKALTAVVSQLGLVDGSYVQVVIAGGSGPDAFTGFDTRFPTL